MTIKRTPKAVLIAVSLLTISTILGSLASYIEANDVFESILSEAVSFVLFALPSVVIYLFFIYKIYKGKRWARNVYLIFTFIILFSYPFLIIESFQTKPISLAFSAIAAVLNIIALFFLFKDESERWFDAEIEEEVLEKPRKYLKKALIFSSIIGTMVLLVYLMSVVNPEELVEKIGGNNGYLVALVVAFLAGFSAATTATAYSVLGTLVAGGLNPLLLGLIAGFSLSLGDMLMFNIGSKGRELVTGKFDKEIKYVSDSISKHKLEKHIPLLSFTYIAFTPLPNDWLILFLASIEYPANKIYKIIVLGNFTLMLIFTLIVAHGVNIFG